MTDVAPLSHSNNLVYPHRFYQRLFQNNASTSSARNDQIRQGIVLPIEDSSQDAPSGYPEGGLTVDVSDAFDLTFKANGILPNIIILSSDNVFFLVHYHKLVTVSHNNFGWLIPPTYGEICNNLDYSALELCLAETTEVLNILLCTIYGIPCDTYHPSFQCLLASLEAINKYGLCLQRHLIQGKPLYNTFLNHIPIYPLEIYAIAGENGLEDLAVASSSYTLSHSVHVIPDYLVVRIGDRYMQRLRNLHAMRMGALKNMFEVKLYPHVGKPYCSMHNRSIAESAFRLKGTEVCCNGHPGISGAHIEIAMCYWVDSVPCPDCRATMHTRVGEIIREWVLLKRTI